MKYNCIQGAPPRWRTRGKPFRPSSVGTVSVVQKHGASDKSDSAPPKLHCESVHYTRYIGGVGANPCIIRGTLEPPFGSTTYNVRIGPDPANVPRIMYGFAKRIVFGPLKSQHTMGKNEKPRRRSKVPSLVAICVSPAREPYFDVFFVFFLSNYLDLVICLISGSK